MRRNFVPRTLAVAALGLSFLSLPSACKKLESGSAEEESVASKKGEALPITGHWEMLAYNGHYVQDAGLTIAKNVALTKNFNVGEGPLAEFHLDARGNGKIVGMKTCRLTIPNSTEPVEDVSEAAFNPRMANAVSAALLLFMTAVEMKHAFHCKPGEFEKSEMITRIGPKSFPANGGVLSERESRDFSWNNDGKQMDRECVKMWGHRYFTDATGSVSCIGYDDPEARIVKLLVQRPGDIYVQRSAFARTGRVFAEGEGHH